MATSTTSKLSFFTFLTISFLISTLNFIALAEARNLQATTTLTTDHSKPGNLLDCWNAALELKSCTDQIVKFFLNQTSTAKPGDSSGLIDEDCCGAIGLTEKECVSVMFTSLGLTNMEGNNLKEYCDVQSEKQELSPSPVPETFDLSPSPAPETFALSPVEIPYPGLDY